MRQEMFALSQRMREEDEKKKTRGGAVVLPLCQSETEIRTKMTTEHQNSAANQATGGDFCQTHTHTHTLTVTGVCDNLRFKLRHTVP